MEVLVPVIIRCRIPDLLEKIGQTQQWLAHETDIQESRISEIVNLRVRNPGFERLMRISRALRCSINDLYEVRWEWRARKE